MGNMLIVLDQDVKELSDLLNELKPKETIPTPDLEKIVAFTASLYTHSLAMLLLLVKKEERPKLLEKFMQAMKEEILAVSERITASDQKIMTQ